MMYDLIAPIYDKINGELDYAAWADFIEENIRRYNPDMKTELVLDLGCGTGRMTLELGRRGYDMTGVDLSPEMLDLARDAAEEAGLSDKMLWLLQDITDFELYGTVELAVSCLDTLNHLTDAANLRRCLSLIHNYLVPDGLFVFDINGKGKFENIYADNSYVMEEDGSVCVWQNSYNPKTRLCDFFITLFEEDEDGRYNRYDELQTERMYTIRTMKKMLTECGFEFIGAYSDFDFGEATDASERIYITARCKKN